MSSIRITSLLLSAGLGTFTASAQLCDTIATVCEKHITTAYIPDGQFYRALLNGDEIAEFGLTLFGGTTYRVAACSGFEDGNLTFSVFDVQHNLLFSNKDQRNAPYWDLAITNTLDVTIEAVLDPADSSSGCAVLLIGIKK